MKTIDIESELHLSETLGGNSRVLVKYGAEWCVPCATLDKVIADLDSDILVARVDCDSLPTLATRAGVMSIPSLQLYDNGELVGRKSGGLSKADLEEFIK